jgi:hypothetical protein
MISHTHFMQVVGDKQTYYSKSVKLRKAQFKLFLTNRYGA